MQCVHIVEIVVMNTMTIKRYSELVRLETFEERYEYLRLRGTVGESTFGIDRHHNQLFYKSERWLDTRERVIIRDNACDLGVEGYDIYDIVIVHHINPITIDDIQNNRRCLYDLNNLISTTHNTHNAIHYGDSSLLNDLPIERKPGDTIPWR